MISESKLNSMVSKWMKSPAGKKRVKEYVNDLRERDGKTASGQQLISLKTMCKLADELVRFVKEAAKSSGVSGSVMDDINSLEYVYQKLDDGKYYFTFVFTADTHRDSMMPKLYPNGIENIIALFNAGYVAENPKWSEIPGPPHMRPTLGFMQDAVDRFMRKYGDKYGVEVELNPMYTDENWTVTAL